MIKTIQLLGQVGINKDAQAQELPDNAWSDGANVRFRNGALERMKGEQQVFGATTVVPYFVIAYYTAGKRYWIHAGLGKVFADDGTTRTEITPATPPSGAIDDRWTGGVLNGVLVLNNGVNNPYFWAGTGVLAPLTGWPASTQAKSIRPFKNVLVALNVTKSGTNYAHMVKWSDAAPPGSVPGSWDIADKTKLAGELELAEDPSLMVDQLPWGDVNIIYKENSMYAMSATGGDDVFRFTRLPGSVGLLAAGCVASTPYGHVVLTHGDVIIHAGQGPQSIINGTMRRWLFRNIDTDTRNRSFVVANPQSKEVWICFPELGQTTCTQAAVWNWEDKTWSIRRLNNLTYGATGQLAPSATSKWDAQNFAWDDAVSAWSEDELSPAQERLLVCSQSQTVSAADVTGTVNGAAYTSFAQRDGITLGDASAVKTIRGLRIRAEASVGTKIQVEVGGSMNPDANSVTWSPPVIYEVGVTPYNQVDTFATGRFLSWRLTSLDNQPWRMTSLDVDFVGAGRY